MEKVKRKGAYEYVLGWHQNHSALVIPKVTEQVLVYEKPIRETIYNHPDIMDFMLRTKVPRSSKLIICDKEGVDHPLQNITRYCVTKTGGQLFKLMPPTPRMIKEGKHDWRRIGIDSGWLTTPCNDLKKVDINQLGIDYDYYIQEIEKLTLGLE